MGIECLATLVASLEERVKNMEKGSSMKFIQVNLVEGIEALVAVQDITTVLDDTETGYTCIVLEGENNMLITTNSFENIKTKLSIVGVSMA